MADWTVVGALAAGLTAVSTALTWMTIGRFADRAEADRKSTEAAKEHAAIERAMLEKSLTVQHEQARAAEAIAAAQRELAAVVHRSAEALDRNTDAMNGILKEALRDVFRDQAPRLRRTVSEPVMKAVRELLPKEDE
jgi:hypothetical protein